MKHHEKLSQKSCINFSGTINTDTCTIEGHYNTTNSTVLGAPKTVGSSSQDELHNMLDEQARLLNEQQKAIHGIQHLQKQVTPNTRPDSFPHQSPPYDPSIPPPNLVLTPQQMNDFDGERTVQVDSPPDVPQTEYTHSDHKLNWSLLIGIKILAMTTRHT